MRSYYAVWRSVQLQNHYFLGSWDKQTLTFVVIDYRKYKTRYLKLYEAQSIYLLVLGFKFSLTLFQS